MIECFDFLKEKWILIAQSIVDSQIVEIE